MKLGFCLFWQETWNFDNIQVFLQENGNFGLPKVTTTMLMAPGGKDFIHLMFKFSTYVLYKCLGKLIAILKMTCSLLFNQVVQDLFKS